MRYQLPSATLSLTLRPPGRNVCAAGTPYARLYLLCPRVLDEAMASRWEMAMRGAGDLHVMLWIPGDAAPSRR